MRTRTPSGTSGFYRIFLYPVENCICFIFYLFIFCRLVGTGKKTGPEWRWNSVQRPLENRFQKVTTEFLFFLPSFCHRITECVVISTKTDNFAIFFPLLITSSNSKRTFWLVPDWKYFHYVFEFQFVGIFFLCVFNDFIRWNFVHRPRCVASPPLFFFSFFLVKKNQSTRKKMKEEEITQPMKRFLLFSLWWKRGNVLHQMSALWRVNEAGPRGFPIRHGAAKVIFRFIFLFFPFFSVFLFHVFFCSFFLFLHKSLRVGRGVDDDLRESRTKKNSVKLGKRFLPLSEPRTVATVAVFQNSVPEIPTGTWAPRAGVTPVSTSRLFRHFFSLENVLLFFL